MFPDKGGHPETSMPGGGVGHLQFKDPNNFSSIGVVDLESSSSGSEPLPTSTHPGTFITLGGETNNRCEILGELHKDMIGRSFRPSLKEALAF
jgi:hypothetical protein